MGDMGDIFREWNKLKQEKRWSNLKSSTELLERIGIPFESKNDGVHLIVGGRIDFWPSTGLWIVRGQKKRHRGVRNLIKWYYFNVQDKEAQDGTS